MPRSSQRLLVSVVALWWGCAAVPAWAQGAAEKPFEEEAQARFHAGEVREDFLVPTSPAFSVLGVAPEEVIRPDSPKALGLALLNGVDPHGNLQTGVALDFSPYYLFRGRYLTLAEYRSSLFTRLASRLQLSFATAKGSDDEDESVKLAVGLRLALLDLGDPRMSRDLDQCYDRGPTGGAGGRLTKQDELEKARLAAAQLQSPMARKQIELERARQENRPDDEERLTRELVDLTDQRNAELRRVETLRNDAKAILREIWEACNKAFEEKHWNATNITVGVAPAFFSKSGDLGGLKEAGIAVYATVAYGFEGIAALQDMSQIVLHGRYRTKDQAPDPATPGAFIEQDTGLVGVQLRIAGPTLGPKSGGRDLVFFGEFDYRIVDRTGAGSSDTVYRYAGGVEFKLTQGVVLSVVVGEDSGDDAGTSGMFAVGNLKWSF
jgi:hypothetical protein